MSRRSAKVYVVDFGHTIVGDLRWARAQWNLAREAVGLGVVGDGLLSDIVPWVRDVVAGEVRPHFVDFAQSHDVFVCADEGEDEQAWARFVLPIFESAVGVAFRRPHLLAKSLDRALPALSAALERPVGRTDVVIVDDRPTSWDAEDRLRVTACPVYAYFQFHDPFDGLPPATWQDPRMQRIVRQLFKGGRPGRAGPDDLAAHCGWCLHEAKDAAAQAWRVRDEFWLRFRLCGGNRCRLAEV